MNRLQGTARALALQLFAETRAEWAFLTDVMARGFRAHRELPSGARRLVAETVYGLVRSWRRDEAVLREVLAGSPGAAPRSAGTGGWRAATGLPPRVLDELGLLVHEVREGQVPPEVASAEARRIAGFALDLRPAAGAEAGLGGLAGLERDAVRVSYPTWLMERLVRDHGEPGALALAAAMNTRAPLTLRANTLRGSREALAGRLRAEGVESRPTALAVAGLVCETRVNVFGLPAFQDGLCEVMDEGSQLVAECVAPPPGGRVVDACAGAGGKTLALGALLGGKGRVLALDVSRRKLEELRRRARRAGLTNVDVRAVDEGGRPIDGALPPARWGRVLCDAPCSGLGTLRRNPEARWRLDAAAVDAFPARQLGLLVTYAPLVEPGGRLIYATCTVLRSENDAVVERFLAERPDFEPVPLKEIWGRPRAETVGDGSVLRLLPHVHDTDGFFAAILRRRA